MEISDPKGLIFLEAVKRKVNSALSSTELVSQTVNQTRNKSLNSFANQRNNMADTQSLKTPMDVYFYILSLNDNERWEDTPDYIGVFAHLRHHYGVWDCNGVRIINHLINALETAIINKQPMGFLQEAKTCVVNGSGLLYVEDNIFPIIHEWNMCLPPDPWRYD